MLKRLLCVMALLSFVTTPAFAQGTFKPRNPDEAHAWRLYNQYKASKQKEAQLEAGIKQKSADIKMTNAGSIPGLGIDPGDVAELTRMRQQLNAEKDLQQKLETAWGKKFFGRYGNLSDSSGTIYDPKTKRNMDRIEFRLIYFPFYANDGTYTGTIVGAPGQITLVVSGNTVTGTVRGTYYYKFGTETYSDPFTGRVTGTITDAGVIQARLSGNVGGAAFTGTLNGNISKGGATGTWTTKALTTASGTFRATRK